MEIHSRTLPLRRRAVGILLTMLFPCWSLLAQGTILHNKRLIEQEHRYEEALANLQKAVREDRNSAPLHYWLSIAYFKNERFSESAEAMERALSLKLYKTYLSSAYEYLGTAYNRLGRYERALQIFDRALSINSAHQEARTGRDAALQGIKELETARNKPLPPSLPQAVSPLPAKPLIPAPKESESAVIMIGGISVAPENVTVGELFEVRIEFFAESREREALNLSVTLQYSVSRDGRLVHRFDPEVFDALNGEPTTLVKKTRASKTPGDYELHFELHFQGQKAETSIQLKIR